MAHFKMAMMEIHDLNHSVMKSTLKKVLKANSFYFSLTKRFSHDFIELLAHADKYINAKRGWQRSKRKRLSERGTGTITTLLLSQKSRRVMESVLIDLEALGASKTSCP